MTCAPRPRPNRFLDEEPAGQGDLYEAADDEPERGNGSGRHRSRRRTACSPIVPLGEESRAQKGGWLSLFGGGRARHESPPPLQDYRSDPTPVRKARAAAATAQQAAPAAEES